MNLIHRLARLAAAALLLACAVAQAENVDKPLDADEGWALLMIDNGVGASSVVFDGPGMRDDLARVKPGVNLRLLRLRAGTYRWTRVNMPSSWSRDTWYTIKQDKRYEFTVQPGVLNYAGDLRLRKSGYGFVVFQRTNRALQAMMTLDKEHPGLRARFKWHSDLASPDPFPEFAATLLPPERSTALQDSSATDAAKTREVEIDQRFSDLFQDLFAKQRASDAWISPDGKLLALRERRAKGDAVVVMDIDSGDTLDALVSDGDVTDLYWGGDRVLYVRQQSSLEQLLAALPDKRKVVIVGAGAGGRVGVKLLRFAPGPLSEKGITRIHIPNAMSVNDPLPDDPRRGLIWRADSNGEAHVFALDETADKFDDRDFRLDLREDRGLERAVAVYSDAGGDLRAAIVAREDERRALAVRGSDGKWNVRAPLPENIELQPLLLSADGSHLVVLTNHERAQTELVKLRLEDGQLGDTLLAVPGADLTGAILRSRDRALIGARYYSGGVLRERYIDDSSDKVLAGIAAKFPGAGVHHIDDSRDGQRNILLVRSETDRGAYYLFDRKARKLEKLVDLFDPLKHAKPVAAKAFSVKAPDGLSVEAFLTLPAGGAKAPLVVMPHGGPIGVHDTLQFDPTVQLLASSGFAVLRVNYRGSGGAGRAFAEAGEGKWGREIEADVDLAVTHALANYPLDAQRVALMGHSYGGYSTLMGLINKPERYRCGVAIAAVTDLPLMFSSSDFSASDKIVARMKKIVGDPATQMDMLRENSPVYQYTKLNRPLLLIHGTEDERVTYEHAWRLRSLLATAGRPPSWLPVPGGDHSLARPKDELAVSAASDVFLKRCFAATAAP
jgi:dipeptidyl aminopeptidase/acylaminoacyl peptidase